ncbi:MAG: hypothetical protein K0S54_609 [Alphaproteobacteria bacterium]|nr:hypothetical protein [Alphaproteobacteria bacterium]
MDSHYIHSSFLEKVLEHIFVGECLRRLWRRGIRNAEVLRSEVDGSGYDVVIEARGITRYIQLKASFNGAKASSQKVNAALVEKRGGCVVWLGFDRDSLQLGPYRWFGADPSQRLDLRDLKKAKHTKGDSTGKKKERANTFIIPGSRFERFQELDDLLERLFPSKPDQQPSAN